MQSVAKTLDKFYTDGNLARQLINLTCSVLSANRETALFVEPSAGAGSFSSALPNCLAYDIQPEGDGIQQADFLTLEPVWDKSAIAIGNPPFGKRARLAIQFVNRCALSCDAVAMVLPNTFRRYNIQNKMDTRLALISDTDLPEDGSFTFEGTPYSLRCVFQIWVAKDGQYWKPEEMEDMRMLKRPPISHPDFDCWQHNATAESRRYVDGPWELAFWRQGYKDYSRVFRNPEDHDEVRRIAHETNLQLFLVRPHGEEARRRILSMDLGALASQNLSTPGFGKADFVAEYMRLLQAEEGDAGARCPDGGPGANIP